MNYSKQLCFVGVSGRGPYLYEVFRRRRPHEQPPGGVHVQTLRSEEILAPTEVESLRVGQLQFDTIDTPPGNEVA